MSEAVETLIVGGGVVGLAVARQLVMAGHEVLIIDKALDVGTETSSRNSEVIHAGIYYPRGSLKAILCVRGRRMLYDYCRDVQVAAEPIGKLIVATTEAEIPALRSIQVRASENGVSDLEWMSGAEARALEPELQCVAALHSPSTGIVDSRGLILALESQAQQGGATCALRTTFEAGWVEAEGIRARLRSDDGSCLDVVCRNLVNCAGHGAHSVAQLIAGFDKRHLPPRYLAKGSYCSVSGKSPFARLIYPIPVSGALGVHLTLDLAGHARLGPDIEWVDELEYSMRPGIEDDFARACQPFWPGVTSRRLVSDYCGIRPKLHGSQANFADFEVQGSVVHGVDGLINLFGIESPGLTSSLALGEMIEHILSPGKLDISVTDTRL